MDTLTAQNIFSKVEKAANEQIAMLREVAAQTFSGRTDLIIGVNGSLARREFTSGSDVDFFFVSTSECAQDVSEDQKAFRLKLEDRGLKMPAAGGVFEKLQAATTLLDPIGGNDDLNEFLTKRMLFLLEGEWIFNQGAFERIRADLIGKYVPDKLEEPKLCLYLLNDIIRYWRTICIDFEYKTSDGSKPRAIRLLKLRFSRMLLCFAGMIAVAEAINMPVNEKRTKLLSLFSLPALSRLTDILGSEFAVAREYYGDFLTKLDDASCRKILDDDDGIDSIEFKEMNGQAREFKAALLDILLSHYTTESPLVRALLL